MKKYRKGVGIFLINSDKKLWVGKRIEPKSKYWQMPQGGIDQNESPFLAMRRELHEEVGIDKDYTVIKESTKWFQYQLPKNLIDVIWKGKYLGQKQKWFACKFHGNDNDIDLNLHIPEFSTWKWINPLESIDLVVPFKKKLYKDILEDFKELYH